MAIRAMSHVAIGVRHMDNAVAFYRDVLGLRVTADRIEEFPQGDGQAPACRRAVYLRWIDGPESTYVVLDQHLSQETQGVPTPLFDAGLHHFAFWVDNFDDLLRRIGGMDLEIVMGGDGPGVGSEWVGEPPGGRRVRSAVIRDPEGNYVQIDERQ
jgi:catechol 2,3-dioxygenase-like lactoylglutathione lyase family enzyme